MYFALIDYIINNKLFISGLCYVVNNTLVYKRIDFVYVLSVWLII